jgi:glycosyltransferase involved in cell wall biosynthesis
MKKKKASVVVTMYNGSRFIQEQLDSLRNQTYPNIEVIIADDISKDDSVSIVRNYIENHRLRDTWRIIVNHQNKGYSRNFLETCEMATGDVIFFCDQDDKWNTDKIEIMMHTLEEHPEINLLCCNLTPFTEEEGARQLEQKFLAEMKNDNCVEVFGVRKDTFHCKRSGCTMCIRREYYKQIVSYWVPSWAHDEFVWKMACIDNSCGIVHNFATNRRMHLKNATNIKERTREGRINQIQDMIKCSEAWLKYALVQKSTDDVIKAIEKYKQSLKIREKLLVTRNPMIWIKLWNKYDDCYPRRKGLYLDLYLVFFKMCKKN